jgi:Fe-S cluster assembly iron-binding protein IscA
MTNNFTITDKAKKKIENLLEKENINKFSSFPLENVLIDKSSFTFIEGSMLDFSEKLIENTFKIINPKATASCGCGSSFSV